MGDVQTQLPLDTWVPAPWDAYMRVIEEPAYKKAKGYYHDRRMRIETSPVGNPHSRDHSIIIYTVHLFAGIRNIDIDGHDNCTYRKSGCAEAQPDASFYIGETAEAVPWDVTIIDLDRYPPPSLAIEVSHTSLADDKGEKRLLYESLGVAEYWIIDVQNVQVIAFAIQQGGSRRIYQSQVLPGLEIALLKEAFQRSRQTNHGKVSTWLLAQLQQG
jgi:Uma2 family endonuclease